MKKIFLIFCLVLSLAAFGCGEGLYGNISNKNTNEATQDALDFAFIQGNCSLVIEAYEPRGEAGTLSETELYKYNNSLLACSGFDLVKSLSGLFGTSTLSGDPFSVIQNMMGVTSLTKEESAKLKDNYNKILKSCEAPNLGADMKTVCGMTAAADTVRALGDVALSVSGNGNVDITQSGMEQAISGKSSDEILGGVQSSGISADELNRNLGLISEASTSLGQQTGLDDISGSLDKFSEGLKDPNAGGKITDNSLADYIYKQFNK